MATDAAPRSPQGCRALVLDTLLCCIVGGDLFRRKRSIARPHGGQMNSRIGTQTNMSAMTRTVMMMQRVCSDMTPPMASPPRHSVDRKKAWPLLAGENRLKKSNKGRLENSHAGYSEFKNAISSLFCLPKKPLRLGAASNTGWCLKRHRRFINAGCQLDKAHDRYAVNETSVEICMNN
jgi:hypothetical protein